MSQDIKINLKTIKPLLKKAQQIVTKHAVFGALMIVLLAYLLIVWRVNQLSNATPTDETTTTALAQTTVPKIDKNATSQIQNLEQTNTQVQSLFDNARNNPFQE